MLSSEQWCWRTAETDQGVVKHHKVIQKKKHRRNHSQRACGEKNEVEQQGYEDSEKNIADLEQ